MSKQDRSETNPVIKKDKIDQYFKESLKWYEDVYINLVFERNIWFIINIVMILVMLIYGIIILQMFPLKVKENILIRNYDSANNNLTLVKIANSHNINREFLQYLIVYYIKLWEDWNENAFNYQEFSNRLVKVHNISDSKISYKFQHSALDKLSEHSSIADTSKSDRLRKFNRLVTINNVQFVERKNSILDSISSLIYEDNSIPQEAIVEFSTNYNQEIQQWRAFLKFQFAGIIRDFENNSFSISPFVVKDYMIEEIK